jgi:polysaccharide pyruvyl transferase WcaK-like protein
VEILDHHSARVDFAEWRCALNPVLPTPVPESDIPLYRKKTEKFFAAFRSYDLSKAFNLDDPPSFEQYDVIVVGSDEVWNLSHPWYGGKTLFYGSGIKSGKLISYAASFGNYDSSNKLESQWASMISEFDRISVRDYNSSEDIKNSLGFQPEIVLDPCLLYPVNIESKTNKNYRYIAVYGHNFSPFFAQSLRFWADRKKIKLISIGYRNDWAHQQWIDAGPDDFIFCIAQSEAVITNFFHGCIFSLSFFKPFICDITQYRSNKIRDLMRLLRSEYRISGNEDSPDIAYSLLALPPENHVLERISNLRNRSDYFLRRSLLVNIISH